MTEHCEVRRVSSQLYFPIHRFCLIDFAARASRHNDFQHIGRLPPTGTRVRFPTPAPPAAAPSMRRAPMAQARPRCLGRDGPHAAIAVAAVAHAPGAAVPSRGALGTRPGDREPRLRQRPSTATPLRGLADAGPCGSWRSRSLPPTAAACGGDAPARRPHTPGERGATARREAPPLPSVARAGARPAVDVPPGDAAARRALPRARAATRRALPSAPGRRQVCGLRPALRDTGRAHGHPAPLRWRAAVVWPPPRRRPRPPPRLTRAARARGHRRQGSGPGRRSGGAGATRAAPRRRGPHGQRPRRRPAVGTPRQRSEAGPGHARRAKRPAPTDARQGAPNPRLAAGAPSAACWLRLCRCPEETKHADLNKIGWHPLTWAVIATLAVSRYRKRERWRQSAPLLCSA
jgi:hypothetical protein